VLEGFVTPVDNFWCRWGRAGQQMSGFGRRTGSAGPDAGVRE
jgi:hypothetical protein